MISIAEIIVSIFIMVLFASSLYFYCYFSYFYVPIEQPHKTEKIDKLSYDLDELALGNHFC